jgi:hypothetical protein
MSLRARRTSPGHVRSSNKHAPISAKARNDRVAGIGQRVAHARSRHERDDPTPKARRTGAEHDPAALMQQRVEHGAQEIEAEQSGIGARRARDADVGAVAHDESPAAGVANLLPRGSTCQVCC